MSSADFQKLLGHLVITVHCVLLSSSIRKKIYSLKSHARLKSIPVYTKPNSSRTFGIEYSRMDGRQPLKNFTWSILEYFVPFVPSPPSQSNKAMVSLKTQNFFSIALLFSYSSACLSSLSNRHTTNNRINHFCISSFINCGRNSMLRVWKNQWSITLEDTLYTMVFDTCFGA